MSAELTGDRKSGSSSSGSSMTYASTETRRMKATTAYGTTSRSQRFERRRGGRTGVGAVTAVIARRPPVRARPTALAAYPRMCRYWSAPAGRSPYQMSEKSRRPR